VRTCEGNAGDDRRPGSQIANDGEGASQFFYPLAHTDDAEVPVLAIVLAFGCEAKAVVGYFQKRL
jgi:hypothetical protein